MNQLSWFRVQRSILTAPVQTFEGEIVTSRQDLLAVEEPLEIRIGETPVSITMRTPGHDFELAAGFLFTEGILASSRDIASIRSAPTGNSVTVELTAGAGIDLNRLQRHFYTSSSCGVCGKTSIEAVEALPRSPLPLDSPEVPAAAIHRLTELLRAEQSLFDRTGGLHAAALFDRSAGMIALREDVGRHNAVDKLIGSQILLNREPLHDFLMLVSGRASFELVQKAVVAGIPILAAVGAPSSLAVQTALRFNMTLLGFVRDGRFNIYSGASRIQ